ncbi:MAG: Gfo/Idh/MocA family protein [Vibrio sp.]
MDKSVVRWGIAGLGHIAHRFVEDLVHHCPHSIFYGAAARHSARAEVFVGQFGGQKSYESYEALAQDPNIDVVYIATINPSHKPLIELYLTHGKHVLVEKPALTNVADWEAMMSLADEKGLLLVEAMKTPTFPAYRALRQFIQDNQLVIDYIEAAFGGAMPYDANNRLFDGDSCGGASLDVGVYPLWLYADLCECLGMPLGEMKTEFVQDNPQSRVDETAIYHFSGAVSGKIGSSITRDLSKVATLTGPDLTITIAEKWWNPKNITITYQGEEHHIDTSSSGGGFEHEILHMTDLIRQQATSSDVIKNSIGRQVIECVEAGLMANGFTHLTQID